MESPATKSGTTRPASRLEGIIRAPLDALAIFAAVVVVVLPLIDLATARLFYKPIEGANAFVDELILVLAFVAAALASLDKRHLSLGRVEANEGRPKVGPLLFIFEAFGDFIATTTQAALFWASLSLVFIGFEPGDNVWGIPIPVFAAIMPLSFMFMAIFIRPMASIGLLSEWESTKIYFFLSIMTSRMV